MTITTDRVGPDATDRVGHTMNQLIGQNIKSLRKNRKMKQGTLAAKTGFTQAHLSYMEKGERPITVDTLALIANALNCQMANFLPVSEGGRPLFPPQIPL